MARSVRLLACLVIAFAATSLAPLPVLVELPAWAAAIAVVIGVLLVLEVLLRLGVIRTRGGVR